MPHFIGEVFGHEDDEDGVHPVVGKPLGRFVPYDVGDAGRHRRDLWRRSKIRLLRHDPSPTNEAASGRTRPASVSLTGSASSLKRLRWPALSLAQGRPSPAALQDIRRRDVSHTNKPKW